MHEVAIGPRTVKPGAPNTNAASVGGDGVPAPARAWVARRTLSILKTSPTSLLPRAHGWRAEPRDKLSPGFASLLPRAHGWRGSGSSLFVLAIGE